MTRPTTDHRFNDGESLARAFLERWNNGDADGISELFVDDADFVNVVGFWWTNRRHIRKAHDYGFRRIFGPSRIEITELDVRHVTDDVHVIHTVSTLDGQRSPAARHLPVTAQVHPPTQSGTDALDAVRCVALARG